MNEGEDRVEEPLPSPSVDPVEQLAHLVPALWRTLTRASRSAQEMPANESQVSILRRVVAVGSLSPTQLADDLHIARPTVSNLLKGLVALGMVERRPLESDARAVVVVATDYGRTVLESFRRDRAEVLRDGLGDLDATDSAAIIAAIPSLRQLLRRLEVTAAEEHSAEADGDRKTG